MHDGDAIRKPRGWRDAWIVRASTNKRLFCLLLQTLLLRLLTSHHPACRSAGHKPGAREVLSQSSIGGIPFRNTPDCLPGQGEHLNNHPTTAWLAYTSHAENHKKLTPEPPTHNEIYRRAVGGVKLKYSGFIPGSRSHFGTSHMGGADGSGKGQQISSRGSDWGQTSQVFASMGVLPIPSMADGTAGGADPPNYRPPKPQKMKGIGDLPSTYSGFRPTSFDKPITGNVGTNDLGHGSHSAQIAVQPSLKSAAAGSPARSHRIPTPGWPHRGHVKPGYSGYVPNSYSHVAASIARSAPPSELYSA